MLYPSVGSFLLNGCKIAASIVRIHVVVVAARFVNSDKYFPSRKETENTSPKMAIS